MKPKPYIPKAKTLTLEELERRYILKVLKRFKGNRNQTAHALQINVKTLRYKLKDFREKGFLK